MSNQYFENNDKLESNLKEIVYYYRGKSIKLLTDNGVFSKGGVDFGSSLEKRKSWMLGVATGL